MTTPHAIDVTRGSVNGTVSAQWASRPDDQKFLNLSDLRAKTAAWAADSKAFNLDPRGFIASTDSEGRLLIGHNDMPNRAEPTNYGFSDIASAAKAPAGYLRTLPPALVVDNLNHGFGRSDKSERQIYVGDNMGATGGAMMRCLTSSKYGRIRDVDVVDEVMKLAGNGTGDTRWKVPGMIDWSNMTYNANVDIEKENTTLYASDRDVFLFLVDDKHPVEVGKLANGDPDLMFRGFYVWNSEVGSRSFGVATMYLRGVCMNRNLWGVEGFTETVFRHTAGAPGRFMAEAAPALQSYAETASGKLVAGVAAAKAAVVAATPEERAEFLMKFGFSRKQADDLILTAIIEEGAPPSSVWDFAQAMTATARASQFQDQRVKLEVAAGRMLDKVTA